jgi:hypothetical protein
MIFADYEALKRHVQKLVREHNALGPKKADCVEMTRTAHDLIELAEPSELGDTLHHKVQTEGAKVSFPKCLGLHVVRWDADEIRVDNRGYNEPLPMSRG